MKIVLVDLDGCIANDLWRRRYIDYKLDQGKSPNQEDYDAYNSLSYLDDFVNKHIIHNTPKEHFLSIVTARPIEYKKITEGWLFTHEVRYDYLTMRPLGNRDHSPELKVELVKALLKELDCHIQDIDLAFDDRTDVLEAYKALGIARTRLVRV